MLEALENLPDSAILLAEIPDLNRASYVGQICMVTDELIFQRVRDPDDADFAESVLSGFIYVEHEKRFFPEPPRDLHPGDSAQISYVRAQGVCTVILKGSPEGYKDYEAIISRLLAEEEEQSLLAKSVQAKPSRTVRSRRRLVTDDSWML